MIYSAPERLRGSACQKKIKKMEKLTQKTRTSGPTALLQGNHMFYRAAEDLRGAAFTLVGGFTLAYVSIAA